MPEPTLQATALRYAAGDLASAEAATFESRLAVEQEADAVAEAVRLSAAALGKAPTTPDRSFRAAIRGRLVGYCPAWLRRRAYRGHPALWVALGAIAVAASTVVGLALADREAAREAKPVVATVPVAPVPREAVAADAGEVDSIANAEFGDTVAEIWAHLSTPDHVEKLHDDEQRWRQKLRDLGNPNPGRALPVSAINDSREP